MCVHAHSPVHVCLCLCLCLCVCVDVYIDANYRCKHSALFAQFRPRLSLNFSTRHLVEFESLPPLSHTLFFLRIHLRRRRALTAPGAMQLHQHIDTLNLSYNNLTDLGVQVSPSPSSPSCFVSPSLSLMSQIHTSLKDRLAFSGLTCRVLQRLSLYMWSA